MIGGTSAASHAVASEGRNQGALLVSRGPPFTGVNRTVTAHQVPIAAKGHHVTATFDGETLCIHWLPRPWWRRTRGYEERTLRMPVSDIARVGWGEPDPYHPGMIRFATHAGRDVGQVVVNASDDNVVLFWDNKQRDAFLSLKAAVENALLAPD